MIAGVHLSNFRNFKDKLLRFTDGVNVIVGANAVGKSNIIESVCLLSTGKSIKARLEEEMISYISDIGRVKGKIKSDTGKESTTLEVVLTRGEIDLGHSRVQKAPRKKLLVNGVSKRLVDFAGNFRVVHFGPQDLDLITLSPSLRRNFLNNVLSQVDREYRRAALSYEKGLRQRNKLLFRIREEGISRSQLLFWDKLLIKNGDYISQKREELIQEINDFSSPTGHSFSLFYDKSAISEARLEQYKMEEVAAATTLVGPHRDDFVVKEAAKEGKKMQERDLAKFGSRGEQRMGILWLKLAELAYIEKTAGERPVLLLDDVFSELDHDHRKIVMEVTQKQQTIITTADEHFIENSDISSIINL